ncbi:MAG: protein-export chaperone SecB [Acidiferrobacter sp.]
MGPLQLDQYVFSKFSVETNIGHKPESLAPMVNVQIQAGLGPVVGAENKYQVTLELSSLRAPDGTGTLPYEVAFQVVGQFSVLDPSYNDKEKLVRINGTSMLYSAAREMVLLITGRGPWGPYQLPTVNFQTLSQQAATPAVLG